MEKGMGWLEEIASMASTAHLERVFFCIRGISNSKIMTSLLQGRPSPDEKNCKSGRPIHHYPFLMDKLHVSANERKLRTSPCDQKADQSGR
jgi:hypothetical protein